MSPSMTFKTFEIVASILICFFGTIGNTLVVLVVYRKKKMKTVTNYFIVNLAVADLSVLLVNIPLDVAGYFADNQWLYGDLMCNIIHPMQTLATTASVWSLVAISISRYVAIVHPLKPQLRRSHARWIIPPVWMLSLILVSPYMASLKMEKDQCIEDFDSVGMIAKYYTLGLFLAQYIIPLIIMAYAYIRVGQELTKNPQTDEQNENHHRETKKVIRMLKIVVFVFAILVLPLHLVFMWKDFFHGDSFEYYYEIQSITTVLLYGNSFTNPIIYNACHEEFRSCFRGYIYSLCIKPCARILFGRRRKHVLTPIILGNTQLHKNQSPYFKDLYDSSSGKHQRKKKNNNNDDSSEKDITIHSESSPVLKEFEKTGKFPEMVSMI